MPKSKSPESSADQALENLSPMIDRIIQAESSRVLAELESLIAERVRTQIWATLQERLGGAAPVRPPPAALRRRSAAPAATVSADQACHVEGCERQARSMGYCSAHYQSARKYDWPRPAPEGFVPPPTRRRGRPPKGKDDEAGNEEQES